MNGNFKVWLDKDGQPFGKGLYDLLNGIKKNGAISSTARNLGMSNYKAYKLITGFEEKTDHPLITSKIGGTQGGGTQLTEYGETLIKKYEELYSKCQKCIQASFTKYFGKIE